MSIVLRVFFPVQVDDNRVDDEEPEDEDSDYAGSAKKKKRGKRDSKCLFRFWSTRKAKLVFSGKGRILGNKEGAKFMNFPTLQFPGFRKFT